MKIRGADVDAGTPLVAYGTLFFPDVMKALLGYVPGSRGCVLHNCARYQVAERVYPVLRIEPGADIDDYVCLYHGLSMSDWRVVDRFEDDRYDLAEVDTSEGKALAYVASGDRMESDGPWDPSSFESMHLTEYVAMCGAWRQRVGDL